MAEAVAQIQEGVILLTIARRRPTPLDPQTLTPPRRPNFNYHLCRLDPMRRPKLGMVLTGGENNVTIVSVSPDGSAFWSGVQARDRVLAIGSEAVIDHKQCEELLEQNEGKIFDILVERPADADCQQSPGLSHEASFQLEKVSTVANTASAGVPETPTEVSNMVKDRLEGIMKNLRFGVIGRKKTGGKTPAPKSAPSPDDN